MTALTNAKHEYFAQGIAKGKSQVQAYADAGYKPHDGAAARLCGNVRIQERVAELLERAAAKTEITVAGITARLLAIASKGEGETDAPLLSVARAALMDAAKLNGLVVDKSQVTEESVQRIIADRPQTDEEWAETHGADLGAPAGAATRAH